MSIRIMHSLGLAALIALPIGCSDAPPSQTSGSGGSPAVAIAIQENGATRTSGDEVPPVISSAVGDSPGAPVPSGNA